MIVLLSNSVFGQNDVRYTFDQTDPKSVVNAMFYAASSQDFDILGNICDPLNMGDDDSKFICWLADTALTQTATFDDIVSESGTHFDTLTDDQARREIKIMLQKWGIIFIQMFSTGKISGDVKFSDGNEGIPDVPTAYVPIKYYDDEGKIETDTVILIQRSGNWYMIGI